MKADARVARWVDVVSDLLMKPLTVFPHAQIADELRQTFDDHGCRPGTGATPTASSAISSSRSSTRCSPSEAREVWESGEMLDKHPLIRWFAATGEPASQSIGRVPVAISGRRDRAVVNDLLEPFECEQQMSIPYELDGIKHRAFVLARSRDDFTDEDIEVARRLQPLLRALSIQTAILSGRDPSRQPIRRRSLRTDRARDRRPPALAEGYTAYGISRRLGISPRTVQKHLEHTTGSSRSRIGCRRCRWRSSSASSTPTGSRSRLRGDGRQPPALRAESAATRRNEKHHPSLRRWWCSWRPRRDSNPRPSP